MHCTEGDLIAGGEIGRPNDSRIVWVLRFLVRAFLCEIGMEEWFFSLNTKMNFDPITDPLLCRALHCGETLWSRYKHIRR